jgi:hypothetical protein
VLFAIDEEPAEINQRVKRDAGGSNLPRTRRTRSVYIVVCRLRLVPLLWRFMKKLRIGIIDIVSRGSTRALYARIMDASLASIMPQVIGVWCREEGHDVTFSSSDVCR